MAKYVSAYPNYEIPRIKFVLALDISFMKTALAENALVATLEGNAIYELSCTP